MLTVLKGMALMSEVCVLIASVFNSSIIGGDTFLREISALTAHSELEVGKSKVFSKQVLKNSQCCCKFTSAFSCSNVYTCTHSSSLKSDAKAYHIEVL